MKKLFAIVSLLLIFTTSIGYLVFLDVVWPYRGFRFQPGWEDSSLETQYKGVALIDSNFTQGWKTVWASGSSKEAGFKTNEGFGVLYANFSGYNYENERGLTGVMIQKSLGEIDTTIYPYLVINHMESSSDSSLAFSFGVTDQEGVWHDGGLRLASASTENLRVDLRGIHNGTINYLSIRFSNDYDPSYTGGIQKSYLKQVVICKSLPQWMLSYNEPVDASILTEEGIMKVRAAGNLSVNTVVSAKRFNDVAFDLKRYRYLRVLIKTSSIDVAARIVVWTDSSHQYVVLLKTYNDANWHTEIVDLTFFGMNGQAPHLVELGLLQICEGADSVAFYQQLSFNSLEV